MNPSGMMASHEGRKTRINNGETIPIRYVCQLNPSVDFSEFGEGFGNSELFVLRSKTVNRKFLFYYFRSSAFKQEGEAYMTGAGELKRVSPDLLRQHHLPCPDVESQCLIADYLDRETARIDVLVTEKERMLALLEEKRAALITAAVTGQISIEEMFP